MKAPENFIYSIANVSSKEVIFCDEFNIEEDTLLITSPFKEEVLSENVLGEVEVSFSYCETVADVLWDLSIGIMIKKIPIAEWMKQTSSTVVDAFNKKVLETYRSINANRQKQPIQEQRQQRKSRLEPL